MEYVSQSKLSMQELSELSEEDLVNREDNLEAEINHFEGERDSCDKNRNIGRQVRVEQNSDFLMQEHGI